MTEKYLEEVAGHSEFWGVAPFVRPSAEDVEEVQRRRLFLGLSRAVARKGYAAASVADVLNEVRISRRTFYELFKDKEDCFLAAYAVTNKALIGSLRKAQQKKRSALAQMLAGNTAHLHFIAAEPVLAQAFLVGIRSAGPQALERRSEIHQEFAWNHKAFHQRLRKQFADLPALPEAVFLGLVAAVNKLITQECEAGRGAQVESLLPQILYITLSIYGLHALAQRALVGDYRGFKDDL